eukprot:1154264-Pelagomonas_calceolata.AAC.7
MSCAYCVHACVHARRFSDTVPASTRRSQQEYLIGGRLLRCKHDYGDVTERAAQVFSLSPLLVQQLIRKFGDMYPGVFIPVSSRPCLLFPVAVVHPAMHVAYSGQRVSVCVDPVPPNSILFGPYATPTALLIMSMHALSRQVVECVLDGFDVVYSPGLASYGAAPTAPFGSDQESVLTYPRAAVRLLCAVKNA